MDRRRFVKAIAGGSFVVIAGQASGVAPLFGQAAAQGDQQRTVNVARLNLRNGAGLGYRVVSVLEYGDIVSISGGTRWADGYEWVQVAVWGTNLSGWVAAKYLSGAVDNPFPPGTVVRVNVDRLNLRSEAGTGFRVIRTYSRGTTATVTGKGAKNNGYLWVPVRVSDGTSGWFASEFLR